MHSEGDPKVLIIGAGPAGLAVSKCLSDLQVKHQLVDREGEAGGAYLRMYPHMQLSSPPSYLRLPGAEPPKSKGYLAAGDYASYLKKYAADNRIRLDRREVVKIQHGPSGFEVTFKDPLGVHTYSSVVACTGSFDKPNIPIISGVNDDQSCGEDRIPFIHACHWGGPKALHANRILIVGGGMTAIEMAEECVQSGIKPILSFRPRRGQTFPAKIFGINPRYFIYPFMRRAPIKWFLRQCIEGWKYRGINRGFKDYCKRNLIEIRPWIQKVQGRLAIFADETSATIDYIVFATGYRWGMSFLPESIPKGHQGNPLLNRGEIAVWPGFFCVGITCAFSASSHFIHGIAKDAKAVAEAVYKRISTE